MTTPQNALDALEAVDYVNRWKRDCKEVYDYAIEKGNYGEAEKIHANLRVYETILTALSAEPLTPPPANASQNALDALDDLRRYAMSNGQLRAYTEKVNAATETIRTAIKQSSAEVVTVDIPTVTVAALKEMLCSRETIRWIEGHLIASYPNGLKIIRSEK